MNRRRLIIQQLTQHPDGLPRSALRELTGLDSAWFAKTMRLVPGVYIDRWQAYKRNYKSGAHHILWEPVYCIVQPEDAPIPPRKATENDLP